MEQEEENTGPELFEKLSEDWEKIALQNPVTINFLKESVS